MLGLQRHGRLGKDRAIEAGLAMDIFGGDEGPNHGAHGASIDLDVGPPHQLAKLAGVLFGERQGDIARHRSDAQNLEFRRSQRQQNGDGVVLAGVGVDDDGQGHWSNSRWSQALDRLAPQP